MNKKKLSGYLIQFYNCGQNNVPEFRMRILLKEVLKELSK